MENGLISFADFTFDKQQQKKPNVEELKAAKCKV